MVLWFIASTASVIQFYNFTYNRHIARGFHPKFPNSALLTSDEGCEPHQIIWSAAYLLPKFHFIQDILKTPFGKTPFVKKSYYKPHIHFNPFCLQTSNSNLQESSCTGQDDTSSSGHGGGISSIQRLGRKQNRYMILIRIYNFLLNV